MKFTTAIMFALALIVGVAVGYMFNPSVDEVPTSRPRITKTEGPVRDEGGAASIAALRARVKELEAQLAEKEMSEEKVADNRQSDRLILNPQSPKEWRDRLKKERPEQFVQMTNNMARWRNDQLERAQKKVDFLSSIDTSKMPAHARKTHEELQSMIAKNEELHQKMFDLENSEEGISMEQRREMWREIHETHDQIRELYAKERQNLMVETAKNLGVSGQDAKEVAEAFQQIIENTEGGFNTTGRPNRGNHGGWGGGPGRGGNRGGNRGPMPPPGR